MSQSSEDIFDDFLGENSHQQPSLFTTHATPTNSGPILDFIQTQPPSHPPPPYSSPDRHPHYRNGNVLKNNGHIPSATHCPPHQAPSSCLTPQHDSLGLYDDKYSSNVRSFFCSSDSSTGKQLCSPRVDQGCHTA